MPAAPLLASLQTAGQGVAPYAVVLGTAQDAGVPQVNCFSDNCEAVRRGRRPRPRVACVGLVDPVAGRRYLIDATPDFIDQVGELLRHPEGDRPQLTGSVALDEHLHGIFLTHAHMGHYTGLVHCGREGAATRDLPLYASRRMQDYLQANEPWAFLFRNRNLSEQQLRPGEPVRLTDALSVTPIDVLHRQEFSDTLGYLITGPRRSLLYVPDADRWDGWTPPFERWVDRADLALLDGSFFSYDELGHRVQGEVPHPPVVETIDRLRPRERPRVWFIHLNNTNPLWDPQSPQNRIVEEAGFGVAVGGQLLAL